MRKRGLGHHVDQCPGLVVVVQRVADALEETGPQGAQFSRGIAVEKAPHRERDGQIVNHRGAAEDRRPPQGDPETTLDRIGGVLARLQLQTVGEAVGDLQGEPLVGTLKAEPCPFGLEADEVGRAVWLPRRGHDVGGSVDT